MKFTITDVYWCGICPRGQEFKDWNALIQHITTQHLKANASLEEKTIAEAQIAMHEDKR